MKTDKGCGKGGGDLYTKKEPIRQYKGTERRRGFRGRELFAIGKKLLSIHL